MDNLLSTFEVSDKVSLRLITDLQTPGFDLDLQICLSDACLSAYDLGTELLDYVGDIVSALSSSSDSNVQKLAKSFSRDVDLAEYPYVEIFSFISQLVCQLNSFLKN